ncbi:MAG TPA: alpha/beta fold hydrolase [Hyphomicrobiaceae bacterium]|nr:alpha/beta fold hydrolase [Hyphomicrobiaceae bacterium]
MGLLAKAALGLAFAYALIVLAAWLGQRRLMYAPDTTRVPPAAAGLADVVEHMLDTPDGARLVVWRRQAQPGRPTILYFHGNAGNLADRGGRLGRYGHLGYGLAALSYRGYGGSTGSPSEASNVADARLLYDKVIGEGVKPQDIVLYGESLGSGVAVQLAAKHPVGALVLDAPYTSIVDVAVKAYPFLPVRPLLLDRYESNRLIQGIKAPLLILHGALDRVVPAAMGSALHEIAADPKKLVLFPRGGHSDLDDHGAVSEVDRWLSEALRSKATDRS